MGKYYAKAENAATMALLKWYSDTPIATGKRSKNGIIEGICNDMASMPTRLICGGCKVRKISGQAWWRPDAVG